MIKLYCLLVILFFCFKLEASIYNFTHGSLGYSFVDMDYEEPGVMSESSDLGGLKGWTFSGYYHQGFILGFEYESLDGNLNYDGSTFSGTPVQTETIDEVWGARAIVGYQIMPELALYAGYGFRHWFDDLVISYTRSTDYHYIPLGGYYKFFESSPLSIFFLAEYDYFISGENKSTLSITGSGRNDVTLKQESGMGYRLAVETLYRLDPVSLALDIYYQYWDIDPSELKSSGVEMVVEPLNNTKMLGLNLSLIY